MKRIVVADDDFQQRDLYVDLFRSAGFEVFAANDGAQAWEKVLSEHPDLVFTGIMMPHMTGFELIEKLRGNKATSSVPVIIFSHLGREEDKSRAKTLNNVLFKIKGYDSPAEILSAAKDLLDKSVPHGLQPLSPNEDERPPANLL